VLKRDVKLQLTQKHTGLKQLRLSTERAVISVAAAASVKYWEHSVNKFSESTPIHSATIVRIIHTHFCIYSMTAQV